jgi:hypothetical protein
VIACEWGSLNVMINDGKGGFENATERLGLAGLTGLWQGIATGDFNNDGRPDLVAANWGLNDRLAATPDRPLLLYYGDLDGDLVLEVLEARAHAVTGKEYPLRGFRAAGSALPWLRDQVQTFEAYGKATLSELYGSRLNSCQKLAVTTLASTVFINAGDRFEPRQLPDAAQWSPAFGVSVGDFNGDGFEDLFLSQNFFAVPPDLPRKDAGRGLWLRGQGDGNFTAVDGLVSGVKVYGEQRGCALADWNADGRIDLVVTQNGGPARLFKNVRAPAGLRVRLAGEENNRHAFGAAVRLRSDSEAGPLREIKAGSGYWSQDGSVQVLYPRRGMNVIEVRWPRGTVTTAKVPEGALEIALEAAGTLKVIP